MHRQVLHCSAPHLHPRCSPGSPERVQCTSPRPEVLERRGGVWGEEEATNPFHDYFKVYLHSCSSDAFSGDSTLCESPGPQG